MRFALVLLLGLGCTTRQLEHFERKELCDGRGVSGKILSAERHWTAKQAYRIGRYLGMEEPVDEVVIRVCNGSPQPIYIYNGAIAPYTLDWHGRCDWQARLTTELDPGRALVLNQFIGETDDWTRVVEADIHWAQHGEFGALHCDTLHVN